jgi:hypothetical protein
MAREGRGVPAAGVALALLVVLSACTTLCNESDLPRDSEKAVLRVSISRDFPVPDGFDFGEAKSRVEKEGDAADLIAGAVAPFLRVKPPDWDRNADIRTNVQPAVLIPETVTRVFLDELAKQTAFVVADNPSQADAEFVFQVEKMDWQDTLFSPFTAHSKPRLFVTAMLIGRPPHSPESRVYWRSKIRIDGTYRPAWAPAWHVNTYVREPEILRRSLTALGDRSGRILAENFLKEFSRRE